MFEFSRLAGLPVPGVVLLGVDHWHAEMHARAARAQGLPLLGVWGEDPTRRRAMARRLRCPAMGSLDEALALADRPRPPCFVVMGRPAQIAERGLCVIRQGAPLIIEKPVGVCAGDMAPLLQAQAEARDRGQGFVAVALPHGIGMLAALDAHRQGVGRLGLSHMHFELINGPPQRYIDDGVPWVLQRALSGGGALRNLGIHGLHAFLALNAGHRVRLVHASLGPRLFGTEVEDYAVVQLQADNGCVGTVQVGYTHASLNTGLYRWRVAARGATWEDDGAVLRLSLLDRARDEWRRLTRPARRYEDFFAHSLKAMAQDSPPIASLGDLQRAMALIDRAYVLSDPGGGEPPADPQRGGMEWL
ncbi:hypothetical protein LZ017_17790 [Pelomonas sp. CA6]|uniref:Gfo/Idh/MocA family protein n=1 Tax=Pelomonas sp. CA6 TaxID=2907999 RepID=UPI001F4C5198|nr:hypothetical protein [Pelomonas sp. CA6]MCH7345238.1 hypothetical protein [Pelomonas sp. CA6]